MGFHGFNYKSNAEIFDEHAKLTAGTNIDISGLSYDQLKRESIQWPFPINATAGTPRLFSDKKFYTDTERATFHSIPAENQSSPVTPDHPLILTTGIIRDQWHTMTKTGKVNRLRQHIDKPPHDL